MLVLAAALSARWIDVPLAIVRMGLVVSVLVAIGIVTMHREAALRESAA